MSETTKSFPSAFDLFESSKEAVLRNKKSFFIVVLLPSLIGYIGKIINYGASQASSINANMAGIASEVTAEAQPLALISALLSLLLLPAMYTLTLEAARGNTPVTGELIRGSMKYFWRLVGLVIVTGLIIIGGLILFIVPGIIFIGRYFLAPYFLVSEDLTISQALKRSSESSKGYAGAIWGVIGVTILLSMASIIPFFGALISMALVTLYACAPAYRYLQLR